MAVLKEAAKTRRVPASDVLSALSKIKKSKVDPTAFFETLGGTESPGRTWMLIFTAQVIYQFLFCWAYFVILYAFFLWAN